MINGDVYLEPIQHKYFHKKTGEEYISLSKLFSLIKEPFDSEKISYFSAKKQLKLRAEAIGSKAFITEEQIQKEAARLRASWSNYNKQACDMGTKVHEALELFSKTAQILPENESKTEMIKSIIGMFSPYAVAMDEVALHCNWTRIAGTADKACFVTNKQNSVVDVFDYKTNAKGILYHNKYNKYYYEPLEFLQDCSYNEYCIKMSAYMYMLETTFGMKPGKLGIIHIPHENPNNHQYIPVPYMRNEVVALFSWFNASDYWAPKKKSSLSSMSNTNDFE